MREIVFYESDFGSKPVEDFLAGLEPAARAKLAARWNCCECSTSSPRSSGRSSGSDLWEVRVEYAGNIYRVLAAFAKGNRVIMLHGFQKKSKKRRSRIWKLLNRDKSGIFNATDIYE